MWITTLALLGVVRPESWMWRPPNLAIQTWLFVYTTTSATATGEQLHSKSNFVDIFANIKVLPQLASCVLVDLVGTHYLVLIPVLKL